jgi:hypothetical protein
MRMMAEAKMTETSRLHIRRQEGPLAGFIILLFTLTILATFSIVGDLLEDGMILLQEDISLSCPMTTTVRFYLPDLYKEREAAWGVDTGGDLTILSSLQGD